MPLRTAGSAVFGSRHEVKRLAYSLIGIGGIWIVGFSVFSENPFIPREDPRFPPEPVELFAFYGLIACFIGFTIAGWVLSGISDPPEALPHRLIMTCISGMVGTIAAAALILGIYGLRSWIFPGPPVPVKD